MTFTWDNYKAAKAAAEKNIGRLFRFTAPDDLSMIVSVNYDGRYLFYSYYIIGRDYTAINRTDNFEEYIVWLTPQR